MNRGPQRGATLGLPRAIAIAVLVAFALLGCRREVEDTPEAVLTAWVNAMNSSRSDVDSRRRAYEFLSSSARASLAERAARASQLSGRDMQPWEMLAPGRFAMRFAFDPDALETRIEGDHAIVTARGRSGDRADVPMVREHGHWRIDLGLPPIETIQGADDAGTSAGTR